MNRGRPKNISSPDEMWQYFLDYKKETKSNPFRVQDYVGKDGQMVYRDKERCLTKEGFSNYLQNIGALVDPYDYFSNKEGRYEDFASICSRISREIRQDQIEGGMVGIYNPSVTQRLNGLTEKVETQSNNNNLNRIVIEEVQRQLPQDTGSHPQLSQRSALPPPTDTTH